MYNIKVDLTILNFYSQNLYNVLILLYKYINGNKIIKICLKIKIPCNI